MKLDILLKGIEYHLQQGSPENCEITGLCEDSRKIKCGNLFFCRTGTHTSGKQYLRQALSLGAAAVICEKYDEDSRRILSSQKDICVIETDVSAQTQARLASNFYDFSKEKLLLIGVTGTKGKTTVCAMLQKLFLNNHMLCATVGTNGFFLKDRVTKSSHTTPELFELYGFIAEAVKAGCTHFIAEVSSLAVKQGRIAGLTFDLGIFTNIYPDHIGGNEHASFLEYAYWKKRFFKNCKKVLLNRDDPFSFEIAADKNGVCLLLVHHTRKQQAGDKFEMISGTTGLLGCADGAFLLQKEKRTDLNATLEIVGRDQPDQKLHLTRDAEKLTWQLDHAETELWKKPSDPLLSKLAAVIAGDTPVWNGSATELVALLGEDMQPNILTRRLNVKAGELLNEHGIEYTVKRTRSGSFISLALKAV